MLSIAQCAHAGGSLKIAGEIYQKTIAIIRNSKETSEMTLASVAMAPDEVHVGALAGLGQLATHGGYEIFLLLPPQRTPFFSLFPNRGDPVTHDEALWDGFWVVSHCRSLIEVVKCVTSYVVIFECVFDS